jgi:hypothetical protein
MAKIREVAVKRDKLILDEREKQAAIVTAAPEIEPLALPPAEYASVALRYTKKKAGFCRPFCGFLPMLRCRNPLCSSFLQAEKRFC